MKCINLPKVIAKLAKESGTILLNNQQQTQTEAQLKEQYDLNNLK